MKSSSGRGIPSLLIAAMAGALSTPVIQRMALDPRSIPRSKPKHNSPNRSHRNTTKTAYLKRLSKAKANKRKYG